MVDRGEEALVPLLASLRRPGDEAQWTQAIRAFAERDPRFAGAFARCLVAAAPNTDAARALGPVPAELAVAAEVVLPGARSLGRVDLQFRDGDDFMLLVELKLGSDYGVAQLDRYLAALDGQPATHKALVAVTTRAPQAGEEGAAGSRLWLGSVRWAGLYEALRDLPHGDAVLRTAWRSLLALLREQRDFGAMDVDPEAIHGWARRDDAEDALRFYLNELSQPAASAFGGRLEMRGVTQAVWPWRNKLHIKLRVPLDAPEERARVQFMAFERQVYFTVEGRYEHPKESLVGDAAIAAAEARLLTAPLAIGSFEHGNDGYGHYWAIAYPSDVWLCGDKTSERLGQLSAEATGLLVDSGLFEALAARKPSTPASPAAGAGPEELAPG